MLVCVVHLERRLACCPSVLDVCWQFAAVNFPASSSRVVVVGFGGFAFSVDVVRWLFLRRLWVWEGCGSLMFFKRFWCLVCSQVVFGCSVSFFFARLYGHGFCVRGSWPRFPEIVGVVRFDALQQSPLLVVTLLLKALFEMLRLDDLNWSCVSLCFFRFVHCWWWRFLSISIQLFRLIFSNVTDRRWEVVWLTCCCLCVDFELLDCEYGAVGSWRKYLFAVWVFRTVCFPLLSCQHFRTVCKAQSLSLRKKPSLVVFWSGRCWTILYARCSWSLVIEFVWPRWCLLFPSWRRGHVLGPGATFLQILPRRRTTTLVHTSQKKEDQHFDTHFCAGCRAVLWSHTLYTLFVWFLFRFCFVSDVSKLRFAVTACWVSSELLRYLGLFVSRVSRVCARPPPESPLSNCGWPIGLIAVSLVRTSMIHKCAALCVVSVVFSFCICWNAFSRSCSASCSRFWIWLFVKATWPLEATRLVIWAEL